MFFVDAEGEMRQLSEVGNGILFTCTILCLVSHNTSSFEIAGPLQPHALECLPSRRAFLHTFRPPRTLC